MRIARIVTIGALLLGGLTLSSCATMSEDQCKQGDWAGVGFSDGQNGYPASRLGKNAEACAKYNIAPDQTAYMQGRAKGLLNYCTPISGWRTGVNDNSYENVCSGPAEQAFLNGYRLGKEIAHARSDARDASSNKDVARLALEQAKKDDDKDALRDRLRMAREDAERARLHAEEVHARNQQLYVQMFGAVPD